MARRVTVGYAYIHGFASSSRSRKGVYLREALSEHGVDLLLPDLNHPSFEKMTYDSMLSVIDRMASEAAAGTAWRLIGSSMGGYLAARWAEMHPGSVERLLLLCPGFNSSVRWPDIIGHEAYEDWRRDGYHRIADAVGLLRPLHWEFVENARLHPPFPAPACPVRLVHGSRDDVVPIELSRKFAAMHQGTELVEVDDDHTLAGSLDRVAEEALSFFGIV